MQDDVFDPRGMVALVIDPSHQQRNIALDQLRALGVKRAVGAASEDEAWSALRNANPDIVMLEWLGEPPEGVDFVRRVRQSEDLPNRAVTIFMLTNRGALSHVELAREAGVDGYMRKPISARALEKRVGAAVQNPQPFIVTATYSGPCRRRRQDPSFDGPWRRREDQVAEGDVDPGTQKTRDLAVSLLGMTDAVTPGEAAGVRQLFVTARDLTAAADEIGDANLGFASRELGRYVQALGSSARLDIEVIRTHVTALHQLAHLPHAQNDARKRVAQSLKRMIDKKLRSPT